MTAINMLTSEQSKLLATMLEQKHGGQLGKRYFEVENHKEGQVIYSRVTLRDAAGHFVYPVEARLNTEEQEISTTAARDLLMDYIDAYFDEYLKSGEEIFLTIDWADYQSDGIDFQMKGQILNEHLEKMADELISGKVDPNNPGGLLN